MPNFLTMEGARYLATGLPFYTVPQELSSKVLKLKYDEIDKDRDEMIKRIYAGRVKSMSHEYNFTFKISSLIITLY